MHSFTLISIQSRDHEMEAKKVSYGRAHERFRRHLALGVTGTEQRALPKRDIHEVSQLNICSEIYDGANYTLMGACFNSENIGVISSECFPKLVVKQ